ncbi:outer membrane protein assembly factor BamA [Pararhizobium mangrovi]|uniref:Outer membrane protein assembly factor BamA n=1 Tax=Pararhizobium mangrovi TaxID=2590452 RepID=A0A506UEN1_9HYPH|nr:outer membrane protein assembly factor BamA [Pararhizobium mangrovi]TPW31219.1 outer membrane protein assembly factor BamA [Pararhizobium mangrovi]
MRAASSFLGAASALALSTTMVVSGAAVVTIGTVEMAQAATVSRIVVKGNGRISASTVRGNITIKPGKSFTNDDINESVKQLFQTGLFSDVQMQVSGNSLVVTVQENQIVNAVVFNGNKKIKDEQLEQAVQTKALSPYNKPQLEADKRTIQQAYESIGRKDATVETQVVPLDNGRVNIAFNINEGDRTDIKSINFVGNHAFTDGRLADVLQTKRTNFLSWLTRKDVYNPTKLDADQQRLRQFYYNHGFADFRIVSSVADFDPNANAYTITITVDEGARYKFGNVQIDSSVAGVNSSELRGLLQTRKGDTYNAKDVEDTVEAISDRIASQGYPFAEVTPRGNRDFQNHTIGVSYLVDQGQRAYVERIEIAGNTRTRDYVIRRAFDISEGDAFNKVAVREAKRRLEALGYFSSVDIDTRQGSEPDRVILVVNVQDKPTGEFSIGGGYSTDQGATVNASITERNFLGRGQFIRVSAGGGSDSRNYQVSFTEPYFLGYRLAAGFDASHIDNSYFDNYDYSQDSFTLRASAPITDDIRAGLAYTFERTDYDITDSDDLSQTYKRDLSVDDRITSSVTASLTYDTIDDHNLPREGFYAKASAQFAGVGGDADFLKITGKAAYYHPIIESADVIGSLSAGAGQLIKTNGSVNTFDQFFLGGETIRGFDTRGIGPRAYCDDDTSGCDHSYDDPLGGATYLNASAEVSFPMPVIPQDVGIRGAVFADAGTLYGLDNNPASDDRIVGDDFNIRASVGASIIWASPFGPLRFDYAVPVAKEDYDDVQNFRFGASTNF